MKLGDTIETLAKPIAQVLNLPCLDEQGQLRPESKCAKRKEFFNNLGDSIYDCFWPSNNKQPKE